MQDVLLTVLSSSEHESFVRIVAVIRNGSAHVNGLPLEPRLDISAVVVLNGIIV